MNQAAKKGKGGGKSLSLNGDDAVNIRNLFTNSIIASAEDRKQVLALIKDEGDLFNKLYSIQTERDDNASKVNELKKEIRTLKKK